jgi:hypothetical protein
MTVLCTHYGISRDTGYRWKRPYEDAGPAGLEERSRAPHQHGRATDAELVRFADIALGVIDRRTHKCIVQHDQGRLSGVYPVQSVQACSRLHTEAIRPAGDRVPG